MKIAVDPGHGGKDPGAAKDGLQEKDIVMQIADYLIDKLEQKGHEIYRVRKDDTLVELRHRASEANDWGADVFVSLHINAANSPAAKGAEVIYWHSSGKGYKLANFIQDEITSAIDVADRGVKASDNFVVLEHTKMPAVIVEPGFVTNNIDRDKLSKKEYLVLIAQAICCGIEKYRRKL